MVTLVTVCGPDIFVVPWRAALQALPPWPHVHIALPTVQTVCVATAYTLAAGGVTSLTKHGGLVAKVAEIEGGLVFRVYYGDQERVFKMFSNLSEQVSTQLLACLKNPGLQVLQC